MTTTRTPQAARAHEATRHRALLALLDRARGRISEAQGRWAAISELRRDSGGGWHDVEPALRLLAQHRRAGRSDRWHGTRGSLWQRTANGTRWTRSRSTALPAAPAVSATIDRRAPGPAVLRASADGVAIAVIVQHDDAHGWVAHDANDWGRPDHQLAVALRSYASAATAGARAHIDTAAKLNRRYRSAPSSQKKSSWSSSSSSGGCWRTSTTSRRRSPTRSAAPRPLRPRSGEHPAPHDPANQRAAEHDSSRSSARDAASRLHGRRAVVRAAAAPRKRTPARHHHLQPTGPAGVARTARRRMGRQSPRVAASAARAGADGSSGRSMMRRETGARARLWTRPARPQPQPRGFRNSTGSTTVMSTVTAERDSERAARLEAAAAQAKAAEERGDNHAASAAWRRYSLIADAGRPADELIAEALELMRISDRIERVPSTSR